MVNISDYAPLSQMNLTPQEVKHDIANKNFSHPQGANSTVSRSKMLHILDILLHKFQLV